MPSRDRIDYVLPAGDPDRPFPFDQYLAIASAVRHHAGCTVWVSSLPYGMWWQQLRPHIQLRRDEAPDRAIAPPAGAWVSAHAWLPPDHPGYAAVASAYSRVAWLDEGTPTVSI